jgi:hypothetical protein
MDIISARKSVGRLSGQVLVNGRPRGPEFTRKTAYVPQVGRTGLCSPPQAWVCVAGVMKPALVARREGQQLKSPGRQGRGTTRASLSFPDITLANSKRAMGPSCAGQIGCSAAWHTGAFACVAVARPTRYHLLLCVCQRTPLVSTVATAHYMTDGLCNSSP